MNSLEGWKFESHYNGARKVSHKTNPNSLIIVNSQLDDSRYIKQFRLSPNTYFKASVNCIGKNIEVQQGDGHTYIGANISLLNTWEHSSEFNKGVGTFSGELSISFKTGNDGIVIICLRLGFYCSEATGAVAFSNFKLEEDTSRITLGSNKIRLIVFDHDIEQCPEILDHFELFLERMEKAYNSMAKLNGKFPFNNDTISYEVRKGINAWAYAGNPIAWNEFFFLDYFRKIIDKSQFKDDACFGTIHEMGHNFDMSGFGHINPEVFANLNLCFAVEDNNFPIYFDSEETIGRGLQDGFYRRCYEKSIGNPSGKTYNHDGLLYCILSIKDSIGWEPFKEVFHRYSKNPIDHKLFKPNELLDFFFKEISSAAKTDVRLLLKPEEYNLLMSQNQY